MKILLTGGLGYIGSHTCVELLNSGYEVVIMDNLSNSSKNILGKIKSITGKSAKFYQVDVRNKLALKQIFDENKIDGVIHFAGLKAVGESVEKPIEYYDNNVYSTIVLLDVMKKFNCKSLVFSSSATVYGNPKTLPIKEDFSLSATNPYGRSKLIIEEILQDLFVADNSWSIGILRYFNPVGAHSSGLIGENPNGIPNNLMPYVVKVASGELQSLQVFGGDYDTKDGTGVRDYIHVVDLAKGHIKALEYLQNKHEVLIVNLGTGKGYSVLDVVKELEKESNRKVAYKITNRRSGDIAECYADTDYAKKIIGWSAEFDLKDMCRDVWNWQLKSTNQ
jgi:UDP-glucose 4-epimerase